MGDGGLQAFLAFGTGHFFDSKKSSSQALWQAGFATEKIGELVEIIVVADFRARQGDVTGGEVLLEVGKEITKKFSTDCP